MQISISENQYFAIGPTCCMNRNFGLLLQSLRVFYPLPCDTLLLAASVVALSLQQNGSAKDRLASGKVLQYK